MDETAQAGTPEPQPEAAGKGKSLLALAGLVVALAAGGVGGFLGVSRLVSPARASQEHAAKEEKEGKKGEAAPLYQVENLVVNPAGTKGSRFLIMTIALETDKPETVESLKQRDPELRDAFLRLLSARTVDELSDIGQRDSLKAQLKRAAEGVAGAEHVRAIFLPQFVLQ